MDTFNRRDLAADPTTHSLSEGDKRMSQDEKSYEGQCFCGAVTIEVTGEPGGRWLLPLRRL